MKTFFLFIILALILAALLWGCSQKPRKAAQKSAVPEIPNVVFPAEGRQARVDGQLYYLNFPITNGVPDVRDVALLKETLQQPPAVVRPLNIMLDPGHGGTDQGCSNATLLEKTLTLDIAKRVATKLRQANIPATLTRVADATTLTLAERVALADSRACTLFVTLHVNSASNPNAQGIEVFTLPLPGAEATNGGAARSDVKPGIDSAANTRLALDIQKALLRMPDTPADRGLKRANFYLLRNIGFANRPAIPAVLVEVGFITHAEESAKLESPAYRDQLATAVAQGIQTYATRSEQRVQVTNPRTVPTKTCN